MHTIKTFKNALIRADRGESRCDSEMLEALKTNTQTGPGTRHALNNLLATNEESYLEVGLYYGGSFACALRGNKVKSARGITMFHNGYEKVMQESIFENTRKYNNPLNGNVVFDFMDCFTFDVASICEPVTVYMYDADHSKEGHRKGITHFWPCLADRFVLIVDDWNWQDVRDGTETGLSELGAKVLAKETFLDAVKYYNGVTFWLIEK